MPLVVISNHGKYFDFKFTGLLKKKKVDESVNIPDIERTKMPESIICIKIIFFPKVYSNLMVLVFGKEQYCH